eukprot:366227-Chlamydomonas_euryale.AAC.31
MMVAFEGEGRKEWGCKVGGWQRKGKRRSLDHSKVDQRAADLEGGLRGGEKVGNGRGGNAETRSQREGGEGMARGGLAGDEPEKRSVR